MDRIDHLRIFLRVSACGSFAQAADQLNLPRATASLAIQQLERRLGAKLLHRTTRKVGLTPDGEALLARAAALVANMDELEHQFRPSPGSIVGRIKVDVPSRIARRLIAPALPQFLDRHPQIQVDLGATDRNIDLVQEGVDCALRVGPLPSSSLVARPLGMFELINCASPAYLARHGTPETPHELARHWVVNYLSPTGGRYAPWEWVEKGEVCTLEPPSRASANNAETYITLALAGLGLIQIPAFDVADHLQAGELVAVMPQARPDPMAVNLVYPQRHMTLRMQVFADWIAEVVRPHVLAECSR